MGKAKIDIDEVAFRRIAEQQRGQHSTKTNFWMGIANSYHEETGIPISWGTCMNRCEEWRIEHGLPEKPRQPRTKKSRNGQVTTELIEEVLKYLYDDAVDTQWLPANQDGWRVLNACRQAIGRPPVEPCVHPTMDYFTETEETENSS